MDKKKTFKTVNLNLTHQQVLDLGIPEITVIEKSCTDRQMLLTAVPSNDTRPERCPQCGNDSIVIQKKSTKQFRDLDIGIYHVGIVLHFNCYRCKGCNTVLTPDFPFLEGKCTNRLKEKIQLDSFEMEFADVAKTYGIPPMTVGRYFREKAAEYWSTYELVMPEVLGLDEVHLKNHYYGVFVSVSKDHGDVLDITENRNKESIKAKLLEFDHPERLKMVTMDMWRPYRDAVKDLFPGVLSLLTSSMLSKNCRKG